MKIKINLYLSLLTLFSSFFLLSCKKESLTANGNFMSEVRPIGSFTKIMTSGSTPIYIRYGTEPQIRIEGSENLVRKFNTDRTGSTVNFGYPRASISKDDVKVYLTIPMIEGINISGNSDIEFLNDFPPQEELEIRISGSGTVLCSGSLKAKSAAVNISGSGTIKLQKLNADYADFKISGSGDCYMTVNKKLEANISGSGNIYYQGNPELISKIKGSGKLIRL
jgi:hypothetical protein